MKTYEIVGLRDAKQAQRIYERLADALGEAAKIELDAEHGKLK